MGKGKFKWNGKDGFFEQNEACCPICELMSKNDREDRPLIMGELRQAFDKAKKEGIGYSV